MSNPEESAVEAIRFPTGHSISQIKRNAKRLSDELNIPLNKALDISARQALGIPESRLHWAQAVSILKHCHERFSESCVNVVDETLVEIDPARSFKDQIVVAFDVKDALDFKNPGPWKQNRQISVLMGPVLVAWLAQASAEEDDRETPTDDDIEYAFERCWEYFCYFYSGSDPLGTTDDVIADLSKRFFFQPDAVWMNGKLYDT